jgi:UDP-glucose 4-epimerase
MKKVIVTGGAGFIGSHTCVELAAAGFRPIIVDDLRNSEERAIAGVAAINGTLPSVHRVDCGDEAAMQRVFDLEGEVYGAIHFAADKAVGESVTDPLKYYHNNIGSLVLLLKLMAKYRTKRIVFSSSCTVYGQPEQLLVTETAPDRNAMSPYGFTKIVCEQVIRDTTASDPALKAVLLRYFNPIGAHPSVSFRSACRTTWSPSLPKPQLACASNSRSSARTTTRLMAAASATISTWWTWPVHMCVRWSGWRIGPHRSVRSSTSARAKAIACWR